MQGNPRYPGGMDGTSPEPLTWMDRWKLAWRVAFDAGLAQRLVASLSGAAGAVGGATAPVSVGEPSLKSESKPSVALPSPAAASGLGDGARAHASALVLLAALQREGRLVDFLQQDVTGFSDEDVAAAARVVHAGCRRVLRQTMDLEPAVKQSEGSAMSVPAGFDAQRIRLAGNVAGEAPYRGTVRHAGWFVREARFPAVSDAVDPRVLAAAEVELS